MTEIESPNTLINRKKELERKMGPGLMESVMAVEEKEVIQMAREFQAFTNKNKCFYQHLKTSLGVDRGFTSAPNFAVYREGVRSCIDFLKKIEELGRR